MNKQRTIPIQYLGAFKKGHRKSAREFIDEDLAFKLLELAETGDAAAEAELRWLTQFNNEYYGAKIKKGDSTAFHNTDELRADCNDRSNGARRDIYTFLNKTKKEGGEL